MRLGGVRAWGVDATPYPKNDHSGGLASSSKPFLTRSASALVGQSELRSRVTSGAAPATDRSRSGGMFRTALAERAEWPHRHVVAFVSHPGIVRVRLASTTLSRPVRTNRPTTANATPMAGLP